jgi:hypothetical protein
MKRMFAAVVIGAVLTTAVAAIARDLNVSDMITAKGDCQIELVKGAGLAPCNPGVIYMLFKNGRHLLTFTSGDSTVIVAGAGDRQPRLEDYYFSIDTIRLTFPDKRETIIRGMEGECHFRLTKAEGNIQQIECDVYNRAQGLSLTARVYNVYDSKHEHFK